MKICLLCDCPLDKAWKCLECGWTPTVIDGFAMFAPEIAEGFADYSTGSHNRLARIEEKSFWFVSRNRLIAYLLDEYFPEAGCMMEIGCGNGFVLAGLAKHRPEMTFYGAEAYPSGLKHARQRLPEGSFFQMDARRIPFVDEFDVIGAFDVIEHIAEDRAALGEMHKAVKPGGGIMISVPQHPWLWSKTDENAGHKRRYTRRTLHEKIQAAGFDVRATVSYISLLLPVMLASRLKDKRKTTRPKKKSPALNGLQLPEKLNMAFMKVCDLERAIVRSGISFPVGGSLLCIACKKQEKQK